MTEVYGDVHVHLVIQNQRGSMAVVRAWSTMLEAEEDIALMRTVNPDIELNIHTVRVFGRLATDES